MSAPTNPVLAVATIEQLLALDVRKVPDNAVSHVEGYRNFGDGGGGLYRWAIGDTAPGNGGTVLDPGTKTGRWRALHNGVGDFRRFGIFDSDEPADAALDAMVNDLSISRIEGNTNLRFTRRHIFRRSDIELDFGGNTVSTDGIERNTHDNPFGAVLFFQGTVGDSTVVATLTEAVPELTDAFPVPDSSTFAVGQWWTVTVNPLTGADERELQKMVQITQIVDATHIRVNYQNGWEFAPGRQLTWSRVEPVQRAHVRNMVFEGFVAFTGEYPGSGPDDREYSGSHPIAYEYAVHCDVSGIHATGTWWPVIMRRWCTHFTTAGCTLTNPPTVFYGGAGYLTQNIYCLYGHIVDCRSSNARHLNDLTASAHCVVENCHGDGDDAGGNPFTTHGQYEHDLVFTGNSGLMDIANSGGQWGISAKRITIRRHVCSWFVAGTKITDLTLEDVRVIPRSTFDPAGTLQVNADGVQMRGCVAKTLSIAQRSARSGRPNIIADCSFDQPAGTVIVQTPVSNSVHFVRTTFRGLNGNILRGNGNVAFTDCVLSGADGAAPLSVGASTVTISGGALASIGIELSAVRDQALFVGDGAGITKSLLSRAAGAGVVRIQLADCTLSHSEVRIASGVNHYRAVGTAFSGGRLQLDAAAFAGNSTILQANCVESGLTRQIPTDGPRIKTTGNLSF